MATLDVELKPVFPTSGFKQPRGVLWDISEEEDTSDDIPLEDSLDYIINTTMESKSDESSQAESPVPVERDIFGRDSPKHRSAWKLRPENYGKVYNLMSGSEIETGNTYGPCGAHRSASHVSYLEQLYNSTDTDDISAILCPEKKQAYKRGSRVEIPAGYSFRSTSDEQFRYLTTLDIQSAICAALNSKQRLLWVVGVETDGTVQGCRMSYTERDCFRQGIDFALSSEFVPVLHPDLVEVKVTQIDADYVPDLYIIEISIDAVVSNLYQLSSGRIFYSQAGHPTMLKSVNDARLMLLDRKRAEASSRSSQTKLAPATWLRLSLLLAAGSAISYALCKRYL